MANRKIGFNEEKTEEHSIEDFKNKWVSIERRNSPMVYGKISFVNKEEVGLLPYQDFDYVKNGVFYTVKSNGLPYLVKKSELIGCKKTTLKNIENLCNYFNTKAKMESLRDEIETGRLKIAQINTKEELYKKEVEFEGLKDKPAGEHS